ncbi:hypothetical protein SAMN05192558_104191 [Actinokineospora alba]|uniref:Uncharacterized protein n=1 Tax=Actinokineospora alba TaxID=504798 RepID=A0A1H0LLK2_9PSEU|nr:hypothetical protein [Actinokineospora alba]TDP67367.1 hypothetical protein C8E96_2909 [Actinokineospora alba]SDI98681.1 hypothetical protein SAMN05421871_109106 [Actinokineospora alba]SDO68933.1 hypothetical protein SAMN05192558_104191 [Actinokineospora alba]
MTEPDRTAPPGVTMTWIGGLVLSGIGFGLAVVALTLPWVIVTFPYGATTETLSVTSIPGQGPNFALLLVATAVAAAMGFAIGRRPTMLVRVAATMLTPAPAIVALFVALRPNTDGLRAALPDHLLADWDRQRSLLGTAADLPVSPLGGLILYAAGLLLVGLGLAIAVVVPSERVALIPIEDTVIPPRRLAFVRWTSLAVAGPLILLSLALPWFELKAAEVMPAIAAGWQGIYRVGLVGTLVLLVGMALSVGSTRRVLRAAGLYLCGGLIAVLSINALLLWDPSELTGKISVELEYLRVGPAYLAALAAVPLLLIFLGTGTLSAPVERVHDDTDHDEEDERADARS